MEGKLQRPGQRQELQLLKLMYHQSEIVANIKTVTRPTRAKEKVVFDIPSKCTTKYLNSPYYIGTKIWNKLGDVQRINIVTVLKSLIKVLYV